MLCAVNGVLSRPPGGMFVHTPPRDRGPPPLASPFGTGGGRASPVKDDRPLERARQSKKSPRKGRMPPVNPLKPSVIVAFPHHLRAAALNNQSQAVTITSVTFPPLWLALSQGFVVLSLRTAQKRFFIRLPGPLRRGGSILPGGLPGVLAEDRHEIAGRTEAASLRNIGN